MIGSRLRLLATLTAAVLVATPARSELILPILDATVAKGDGARPVLDERVVGRPSHRASEALRHFVLRKQSSDPEWLVRGTGATPLDNPHRSGPAFTYVALQIDRLDGMDMLTLRRTIQPLGGWQVYAGAGLGRARYLDADALAKPLPRRRTQSSLGTAVEVGACAQLAERMSVDAALRWTKLGRDVALLTSDAGVTSADAVMLGVTVAYRFR